MKTQEQTTVVHKGNLTDVRRTQQTIDQDSLIHLMGMMKNPYSNLLLAVHREYSANARDSHIEAGQTRPVEIELPTQLQPVFVVRDYGTGLDEVGLNNGFMLYGWSSKRETDEQVGYFGIGCKCGLALTNQFAIVCVKDGVRTEAVMTRASNGLGELQVFDVGETDEPNGVEIRMPIPQEKIAQFNQTGMNFYRFWEPGTIIVDGKQPASVFDETLKIDPDVHLVKGLSSHYFVMGNIPYPLPPEIEIKNLTQGIKVVAHVPIGAIKLTPSRESLDMESELSKDAVATLVEYVETTIGRTVQEEIDQCKTPLEALIKAHKWRGGSWKLRLAYENEKIPTQIEALGQKWKISNWNSKAENIEYLRSEDIAENPGKIVVLTGHPRKSMDEATKKALYAAYPNFRFAYVVHRFGMGMRKWAEGLDTIAFDKLCPPMPRLKGPKAERRKKKWELWDDATKKFVGTDLDAFPNAQIVYILRSHNYRSLNIPVYNWQGRYGKPWNADDFRRHLGDLLQAHFPDAKLAMISLTDLDRFKKLCPKALTVAEFWQLRLNSLSALLSADAHNYPGTHPLAGLDPVEVLDPKLAALARRVSAVSTPSVLGTKDRINTLKSYLRRYMEPGEAQKIIVPHVPVNNFEKDLERWDRDYPLVSRCGRYGNKVENIDSHLLDYLNAYFLYRKQLEAMKP